MSDKVLVRHNHDAYRDIDENQTLEMNVKRALYSNTEFAPNQIITQSNKFKYHDA